MLPKNSTSSKLSYASLFKKWVSYARLMRLDKPVGIWLLLWPALWALWISSHGQPNGLIVAIFTVGVVLMRSAGCVANDIADRRFDKHVTRTQSRPLVAGDVTLFEAYGILIILSLLSIILVLMLNRLTILIAGAGFIVAMIYPLMKRYTHWPQGVLGIAFNCSILMAYAAQTGSLPGIAWFVFGLGLIWTVIYDTFYAVVDREDDLNIGIKSTAILWGNKDNIFLGALHIILILGFILLGYQLQLTWPYYLSIGVAAGLAGYQLYIVRSRAPSSYFKAFKQNQWYGMVIWLGLMGGYFIIP